MLTWSTKLSAQVLAVAAAGLLSIGAMNRALAQDEGNAAPPTPQQNAADDTPDAEQTPANNNARQNDGAQSDSAQLDGSPDDAPPRADDLNFDDQRSSDGRQPPALPDDGQPRDDRRDEFGRDQRDPTQRQRDRGDDSISPSDRPVNGRDNFDDRRGYQDEQRHEQRDVRRFDYDDSSQPIPEHQAHNRSGRGCHPCATRVYHNPCGGCGQSYRHGGSSGYQSQGYQQNYQTGSQNPHRAVIGVTVENWEDGVQVLSVEPNSPAALAGLQTGDLIVAIDGRGIRDSQALMSHVGGLNAGEQLSLTIDRAGDRHDIDSQVAVYSQVFGQRRGNVASGVPAAPQDRFAQGGQSRTAFRPNYEEAKTSADRLERVQMRIGQIERELTALRQEEQDLQNAAQHDTDATSQDSSAEEDSTVNDITPPAETPTPATGDAGESDAAADDAENTAADESDDSSDVDGADVGGDEQQDSTTDDPAAQPAAPSNREQLSPSAR